MGTTYCRNPIGFGSGANTCFMGLYWLLIWASAGPRDTIAVSKGIVLALDLGSPPCSLHPLSFDLEPKLSQGNPGCHCKEASLTFFASDLLHQ